MAVAGFLARLLLLAVMIIGAVALTNRRSKGSQDVPEDIVSNKKAAKVSIEFGLAGLLLSGFLFGLGISDTSPFPITQFELFASISIYDFIVCLFITRAYPGSIGFAGFFINILTWLILVLDVRMFIAIWYVFAAFVIFAYAGSFVGLVLSRKKGRQVDTDQEEE
jgi:hypothetical protein